MAAAYLGLGTNLGEKKEQLSKAVALLAERAGRILALSSLYESEPWGFESENNFLNIALALETSLPPFELLHVAQQIEKDMGRERKNDNAYHDRIIDIDILLYENLILNTPSFILPHPLMHRRRFVIVPLAEIAPRLVHPVLKKNIEELLLLL
ncbi:MAG: 2-amino-4-hydroxy-6-hydroxymethyldihydropteridine diphosphokinase [Tannerellaceae bacterium]|jgi:2-amino-4-hydroxy-6-hydroxymethyldihydropteridine diphosphokinase|nr:2-amino-4-hydroxy-6-hydroxymethyldihydropteridine diphosphokinase [Tannerellaceae bacterium]